MKDKYKTKAQLIEELDELRKQVLAFKEKDNPLPGEPNPIGDNDQGTEAALRESEARYRAIVEDQTNFIVRWTPKGIRTFVNQ